MMAVPFALSRLTVTGTAISLNEYVRERSEGALYAFSESGTLAYVPGSPEWDSDRRLVWVDQAGEVEPLPTPARPYMSPTISPDGRFATVAIRGDTWRIWVYDFLRATLTPLTSGASSQTPIWTADASRVVYRATRSGFRNLFWKPADGSGEEERLAASENLQSPVSFSPDGKWLVFSEIDPSTGYDLWVLPMNGARTPEVFLRTPFNEGLARVSPDGRWLAYMSDESGRREIYVQPFPGGGRKWLISTDGGNEPVWSRDGRRLFYVNGDKMMAVDVTTQAAFSAGSPRVLHEGRFVSGWELTGTTGYDVATDGRRFLRVQARETEQPPRQINVVINWHEELKRTAIAARTN
jgi:dipeptidyl aminopeptidase/acylaminoacyl peptidase